MSLAQVSVDITNSPDLCRIAEAVKHSGTPHVLSAVGEAVAVVVPVKRQNAAPKRSRSPRRAKGAFTRDDPLFGLIGIGEGKTPGGVSGNKHEALARAYRPK